MIQMNSTPQQDSDALREIEQRGREIQARMDALMRKELRDKFAIAALTGLLASPDPVLDTLTPSEYAARAYMQADAMLEYRERT